MQREVIRADPSPRGAIDMAAPSRANEPSKSGTADPAAGLAAAILIRLAVPGGASKADLVRDLKGFSEAGQTPAEWRVGVDTLLAMLAAGGFIDRPTGRMQATLKGLDRAVVALGVPSAGWFSSVKTWDGLRDGAVTLRALGAEASNDKLAKALSSSDALRALIVQAAFNMGVEKPLSLGKLRTMLALRALERAFGNQIKTALGAGSGLALKPSRLLAAQLLRSPKDYASDGRLIAALAVETTGAANAEADTLRLAVIKRWLGGLAQATGGAAAAARPVPVSSESVSARANGGLTPANDHGSARPEPVAASARPDLPGFVKAVSRAAGRRAEGWPGNRKAFICHVWDEVRSAHPQWGLSEIEFKGMLTEAHRTGGLVLSNADLKDKRHIQEFEKSAIQYKNTVWHFVRVEEA
ncbi:MAG: hypothetical protein ACOYLC_15080 [Armatimonadaceae bacterium]